MTDIVHRLAFFSHTFIAVIGVAMATEIIRENDANDKIDDILMVLLSIASIWWYRSRGEKLGVKSSIVVVGSAVLIKVLAIIIEHADNEAVGDDIGVISVLLVAFVFVIYMSIKLLRNRTVPEK